MTTASLRFISCGVLRLEIENILREEFPDAASSFLDSMLHMRPERLRAELDATINTSPEGQLVIVYGDCHAHMKESCSHVACSRTKGINCCELLLGHQEYKRLQREGAFIFLPEWTIRWREIFASELGLGCAKDARTFMRDMRSSLVYLDTGILPLPKDTLSEIEQHFGMPVKILPVSLDHLRSAVRAAVYEASEKAST